MKTLNQELVSRIKTLVWNIGFVALVAVVDYLSENVAGIGIPSQYVVFVGLVLSQVSKFLHNKKAGEVE